MCQSSTTLCLLITAINLQFHYLVSLSQHFENTETTILALDMAEDHIQTDWAALNKIVENLLGQNLVKYMDLGMEYLPPICSLKQSPAVRQSFLKILTKAQLRSGL